jgi:hypothetical protein
MSRGIEYCSFCDAQREIVDVKSDPVFIKKKLSCGHITFRGRLIDIPELSSSKGIEITPKESGVIPVTVSSLNHVV